MQRFTTHIPALYITHNTLIFTQPNNIHRHIRKFTVKPPFFTNKIVLPNQTPTLRLHKLHYAPTQPLVTRNTLVPTHKFLICHKQQFGTHPSTFTIHSLLTTLPPSPGNGSLEQLPHQHTDYLHARPTFSHKMHLAVIF